jgi:hypothetical protein
MRTTSLSFIGAAVLGIVLLNMQDGSVAASQSTASHRAVQTASLLSKEVAVEVPKENVIAKRESDQPLRRIITKAAASPAVIPKQRLIASIEQADIQDAHKLIANEALMSLPIKCRGTLKNFYVKYEKQKHRGLAGKSVMILDGTVPLEEFRALFVHESGHNWDLGCLTGTADSEKSSFSDGDEAIYKNDPSLGFYQISWITSSVQRSNSRPEDFVSGYASYDIFEDFAESFVYFVLQNDVFATRAQENAAIAAKYIWMKDVLFDGQVPQIATGKSVFKGKAPWDVTKLKYVWNADQVVARNE